MSSAATSHPTCALAPVYLVIPSFSLRHTVPLHYGGGRKLMPVDGGVLKMYVDLNDRGHTKVSYFVYITYIYCMH
jgi:hypothetical protein